MLTDVRLRETMQEQQRRAAPTGHDIDLASAGDYVSVVESCEHACAPCAAPAKEYNSAGRVDGGIGLGLGSRR